MQAREASWTEGKSLAPFIYNQDIKSCNTEVRKLYNFVFQSRPSETTPPEVHDLNVAELTLDNPADDGVTESKVSFS